MEGGGGGDYFKKKSVSPDDFGAKATPQPPTPPHVARCEHAPAVGETTDDETETDWRGGGDEWDGITIEPW